MSYPTRRSQIRWRKPSFVRRLLLGFVGSIVTIVAAESGAGQPPLEGSRKSGPSAATVFNYSQSIIFWDGFRSGNLDRWRKAEDDRYGLSTVQADHIAIVDAAGPEAPIKAMRFAVRRGPNSFRSEIALPSEKGFQERWYAAKIMISKDWIFDGNDGDDIVIQWHGIPGNGKPTYPNLAISVHGEKFRVRRSFGDAHTKPGRTTADLDEPVQRGVWTAWMVHARWSPNADGFVEIWRNGRSIYKQTGPNVYGTIGVDYTPYLQTGIYHPTWHLTDEAARAKFESIAPLSPKRVTYVTEIKVGSEKANFDQMSAKP